MLDNCEQVADAAPLFAELLLACPRLMILATSRVGWPLGRARVPGGAVGVAGDRHGHAFRQVSAAAAVRLFVEGAGTMQPGFTLTDENAAAVAEIPQARWAPARARAGGSAGQDLPPAWLLARLEQRLPLLTGGNRDAPARQHTMRDTIAWSYDLLTADDQALFCRLAVFVGGFSLEAAEAVSRQAAAAVGRTVTAVCRPRPADFVLDGIASLVDQSLVRPMELELTDGPPRYHMLETVREFGLERLAASETETAVRAAHAAWAAALAQKPRSILVLRSEGGWTVWRSNCQPAGRA